MTGKEGFDYPGASQYVQGCLAKSLAGHDKDHIFVILREEGEYVYLADGKNRTIDRPKKKKKKHIQIIYKKQEDISKKLLSGLPISDVEIKAFIRIYS
ncbi:hypothetical protein AALB16_07520 [Lachnospiraceae bacterium 62-35]